MASEREKKKKPFSKTAFARYFIDLAEAVKKGDWKVKSSLAVMGMGFFTRKQVAKGAIVTVVQLAYLLCLILYSVPYLSKFSTLGTVATKKVGRKTVYGDNSFLILLFGVLVIFAIIAFIAIWYLNIRENHILFY